MRSIRRCAGPAALVFLAACQAELGSPGTDLGSGGPVGSGSGSGTGNGGSGNGGGSDSPAPEKVWATPAFSRLTHVQWQNTVSDVFDLEASALEDIVASFRLDPGGSGYLFDNHTEAMSVDETLWNAYRRAATDVGGLLFEDDDRAAAFIAAHGGTGDDEAAAESFIADLGEEVHRRPLDDGQLAGYLEVYRAGRDLYPELNDPHRAGLRLVTEAFLQSPWFVYRVELGTDASASENPLDDWEIANRLSYFLWNTAPDEALRAAADSGELTTEDGLRTQAERMLADPRAEDVVAEFHRQLLDVGRYDQIGPSPAFFPDVSERLPELAAEETDLFVRMVYAEQGGLTDLLTSRETFVNDELAGVYGLGGSFGDELTRVELDPGERKGYLTQVGFLASHATPADPDPIHRGIFVSKRLACNTIGVPPGEIPPLPPPEGRTNREVVEDHTEQPGSDCVACHGALINPFGFAFEGYDAIGRSRTEDRGYPVETSGAPLIGGEQVPVSGAMELIDVLAESEAVHACYAKHWMELAFGVVAERGPDGLVDRLAESSLDGASVRQVLLGIVTSHAFRTRRGGAEG